MFDLDKDKASQGIGAFFGAIAVWLFAKLRKTSRQERPELNGSRQMFVDRIKTLETDNQRLRERIITLESESEDGRREHERLNREQTNMRQTLRHLENVIRDLQTGS